ncbi:MAG TPA: ROK family protein [Chitinophagaceae bacterium]|nr:ROK family protein [Chitinophagaceae bacterium]
MSKGKVIGIDLGATNVRGAQVSENGMGQIVAQKIRSNGTAEEVLEDVFTVTDKLMDRDAAAIGIGVPGVVDVEDGIVYDVQYIPSWVEVPLKQLMQARYDVPVFVNNDANCFALGEYYFGKGKGTVNMIGLTIGTGLGAGIIINRHLYAGPNCGAGEFGMVQYLDHVFEYYCSGQFFGNVYQLDGTEVFKQAQQGDARALELYAEMGSHLGNAIKMIMYTYDPSLIIFGGSVRFAYPYFKQAMWERIETFAFVKSIERLTIELSDLESSGILGAAGLYYDSIK